MFNKDSFKDNSCEVEETTKGTDPIGSLVSIHLALLVSIVSNQTLKLGTCNKLVSHFVQLTV